MTTKYAGFPTAFVYAEPSTKKKTANGKTNMIREVLFGDWVKVESPAVNGWCKVRVRGQVEWIKEGEKWKLRPREGWMLETSLRDDPVLQIFFVDIGQGDGCLVITPENKTILIDAGEGDNMWRFLKWLYNTKNSNNPPKKIQHTIISHSDKDHYYGFAPLFKDPRFEFENIWHNGLIERVGKDLLGAKDGGYHTEVISTEAELNAILDDDTKVGGKLYPNLLLNAGKRGAKIRMLGKDNEYLEGFEADKTLKIKVLAPITEKLPDGRKKMKRFSNDGITKNGHSIVLRLEYGNISILLGGDLNSESENYLLSQYTGINPVGADDEEKKAILKVAKSIFGVDIAKSCHHGSADFTNLFMQGIEAAATIISSGDSESHAHPRPETLGAIGKYGRGERPLIFSNELARSANESIKNPKELRDEIDKIVELLQNTANPVNEEKLKKMKDDLKKQIQRTVTVYGLINLRTDGEKAVIAQRLEAEADRGDWDYAMLKPNSNGIMEYVSKNDDH